MKSTINLKNIFFGIISLVFVSKQTFAQTAHEFSVKQCVDYGMKNAIQVKNALLDIKIQQQVNKEFTGNAYPQLTSSISGNHYTDIPIAVVPGSVFGQTGIIALPFGTPWNGTGEIDVSQILFDGQVFIGLKARKAALELASKSAELTETQIKANIYKIYYQLVVGKKQLESVEANIDRYEKLLSDTKEIYKNGFAEKLDVDKVTVALTNLKTEKQKVSDQLSVGNAGLKFLINIPMKDVLILTDTMSDDDLKSNILDSSYDAENRKDIQLLKYQTILNQYNVKRYQYSKYPTIAAFGSYSKNAYREQMDLFSKGDWYTTSLFGIKISINIFNGFSRNARIANAKLVYEKSTNSLEAARQQVDYDVFNARIKMKTAILTADDQKRNIELSETVYNTTKKKYEQGLGSNSEIYEAQTELKVAQNNYYSALYDAITAKVDYLLATGKL